MKVQVSREMVISIAVIMALSALAALSRYSFIHTESRVQITAFWILSGFAEWGLKPLLGIEPKLAIWLITGVCTTSTILLVRWSLEGLCPHTWPQCPDPIDAYGRILGL
jgi:predicted cobalt transporter CbtA